MHKPNCLLLIVISCLCGCGTDHDNLSHISLDSLEAIQSLQAQNQKIHEKKASGALRVQALSDTAMSVGAQAGLAWRVRQIHQVLTQTTPTLERVFNFQPMMLEHNVMSPVLAEGRDTLHQSQADLIRVADRSYRVVQQARFMTHLPNWRDYLWLNFQTPLVPDNTLLPKTSEEVAAWRQAVEQGWHHGIAQADTIFKNQLARLKHHYLGMILYKKLLTQNMISKPFVAKTDLGVTGDEQEIRIHDQVLRISALPSLNQQSHTWQPVIIR